jgi:hypothetical protein
VNPCGWSKWRDVGQAPHHYLVQSRSRAVAPLSWETQTRLVTRPRVLGWARWAHCRLRGLMGLSTCGVEQCEGKP